MGYIPSVPKFFERVEEPKNIDANAPITTMMKEKGIFTDDVPLKGWKLMTMPQFSWTNEPEDVEKLVKVDNIEEALLGEVMAIDKGDVKEVQDEGKMMLQEVLSMEKIGEKEKIMHELPP